LKFHFRRSFQLGSEADDSKINAKLANGVLSVVISKAEKAMPKKIKVETA
jgi:HSP20 family molecular chaperone IbpA